MWILICIAVIAVLAFLVYLHGVFKPISLYDGEIQNPQMLYYSYKGSR